ATMAELAAALGTYLRLTAVRPSPPPASEPVTPAQVAAPPDIAAPPDAELLLPPTGARPRVAAADAGKAESQVGARHLGELGAVHQASDLPAAVLTPAGLLRSWRRWTTIVRCFATGRVSRRSANHHAFTALRNRLLATLRARSEEVQGPERDF